MANTMQKNQSITELLAAEKVAAGKIDEARKRKAKRFKDAQNEAKAEIEELRNQHETKLRSLEKEVSNHFCSSATNVMMTKSIEKSPSIFCR